MKLFTFQRIHTYDFLMHAFLNSPEHQFPISHRQANRVRSVPDYRNADESSRLRFRNFGHCCRKIISGNGALR
jgi:hypothetical protein